MASQKLGSWAFLIAVIIAVIAGLVSAFAPSMLSMNVGGIITLILVILGLVVGFLNIHDKHITDFLIATIAIALIGGTAGGLLVLDQWVAPLGSACSAIVLNIVAIAAAAALVVGLKQIFALAKEQVQ